VVGSSGCGYEASHALHLGELLADPAPHGVLVAVPNSESVLFHPVLGGESVVSALRGLPRVVDDLYGGELGALSPHVYWWDNEVFEQVGIDDVDDHLTITGSERFAAMVNRLLQESADSSR